MVFAQGKEDEIENSKKGLIYIAIAFAITSMSQDLARIFDLSDGTIIGDPQDLLSRVRLFDKQLEIVITFIKYTIGTFATIMVIRSAIKLITAGGNEEETSTHRKGILYSAGGLVLIFVADVFINKVFYKINKDVYSGITGVNPGVDAKEGVEQLAGITNFIVSFIGPVAILMLIVGGLMYATASGNDEQMDKAKRLVFTTIIAIIIIYGAFALVSTVISSRLTDLGAIIE